MYFPFKDFDVEQFFILQISPLAEKTTFFIFGQILAT